MYQQQNISTPGDVIPAIVAFAQARGWTVTGGTKLTRPGGGKTFALTYAAHVFRVQEDGVAANFTTFTDPSLRGTNVVGGGSVPERPAVSALHLFGDTTPEPFIGVVIEYGFNQYRHVYIGNMQKVGGYTGGEVISSNMQYANNRNFSFPLNVRNYDMSSYLFGGRRFGGSSEAQAFLGDNSGGVNVVHARNPTPWRRFRYHVAYQPQVWVGDEAFGGLGGGFNDPLVQFGRAAYAGATLLSPVNLFAPIGAGANALVAPIGSPAGVRMVNLDGIDPGGEITLGDKVWKCFPEFSKQTTNLVPQANGNDAGWAAFESSEFFGLAYPKS